MPIFKYRPTAWPPILAGAVLAAGCAATGPTDQTAAPIAAPKPNPPLSASTPADKAPTAGNPSLSAVDPALSAYCGCPQYKHQAPPTDWSPIVLKTGRYSAMTAQPTYAQRHPLDVVITVSIPDTIRTIGESVLYLLRRSGYGLDSAGLQPDVEILFAQPLPEVQRRLGPITLHDALTVLMAPSFELAVDPVRRLVNYQYKPTLCGEPS